MLTTPETLALARRHLQTGNPRQAEELAREALRTDPGHFDALSVLASAFQAQGRLDQAETTYRAVATARPELAEIHLSLGNLLLMQKRLDEAAGYYREALARRAAFPAAHTNLGSVLQEQGCLTEAEACHRRALAIAPEFTDALFNLGNCLKEQGRDLEAIAAYREVLRLLPSFPQARMNLGLALLRAGRMRDGWTEFEWRFACRMPAPRHTHIARWDGQPAPGKSILIHSEQGLGDVIVFARYVPLVRTTGMRVVFEVPAPLARLFQRSSGADELVEIGWPAPRTDYQAPLLSLPGLLGTTLETIPATVPYIEPDPVLVEHWREKLAAQAFKVGIAWQGDAGYRWDSQRSMPLAEFAPLAAIEGVRLYSLQKGYGTEQLAAAPFPVDALGGRLDDQSGPFMDSAAIIRNLDLVVSADTVIAHLAGALGKPVWLPLAAVARWVWLSNRDDSPWYPSARLFRQRQPSAWGEVFTRMVEALRNEADVKRRAAT